MLRSFSTSTWRPLTNSSAAKHLVAPVAFLACRMTSGEATASSVSAETAEKKSKRPFSNKSKRTSPHRRTARGSNATYTSARRTARMTRDEPTTRRLRSLDIATEESQVDVERHFPAAVSFLRQPSRSPYAADEAKRRRWHDITHDVNADGAPVPHHRNAVEKDEGGAEQRSFFDEGSLDIRGGLQHRARQAGMDLPSHKDDLSPDILKLTGGSSSRHGLALATESNAAPADETIEGDASENQFGDTPVELTDMLRERLMELKAERISEERNETFLPRRLHLATDAQLQRAPTRHQAPSSSTRVQTKLLEHATRAAQGDHIDHKQQSVGSTPDRTLADLMEPSRAGVDGEASSSRAARTSATAAARDGYQLEKALPVALSATSYAPGGLYADDTDTLLALDNVSAPAGARPADSAAESEGCVYLLRVLPRAGFCSRREAVAIVASGQVTVGGVVERNPFRLVRAEDDVRVSGHQGRLRIAPPRLWMYHKPANVVVSRNDPAGRRLITRHANILGFDHLVPVGSLPMRSHGILMLTNDGELSRYLENPQTMIQHTYLLRVRPAIDPSLAQKLNEDGININGRQYRQAEFLVNPAMKSRFSLKVKVRGETLPISHLMQHLGRVIERGGRTSFGPFSLGSLAVGSVREVTVPPHYMAHLGTLWKPFVERDWPYFRRQRVNRLRRLCRYRELTPKELEELDNFTYEELHDALALEDEELAAAAEARAAALMPASRISVPSDEALAQDFPPSSLEKDTSFFRHHADGQDDFIVEDITRLR